MDPFEPPPHARRAIEPDGEIAIWQVRPDIVLEKASGTFSLPLARCLTDFLQPMAATGTNGYVFADFERLTRYTREAREHMSAFAIKHIAAIEAIHFLISAKHVAMGLSSFKQDIGTGRVRFYTDRASFLQSYREALGEGAAPVESACGTQSPPCPSG